MKFITPTEQNGKGRLERLRRGGLERPSGQGKATVVFPNLESSRCVGWVGIAVPLHRDPEAQEYAPANLGGCLHEFNPDGNSVH